MNNIKALPRLLAFAAVAKQGSFTKAADYLGLSKAAVSQQVSQLEADLGIKLLHRTTRELSLTALGSQLLERCINLQDQVDLLFNDIEEAGVSPSGRFAITYPHSIQCNVIIPAVEQLCREFPKLEPVLIANDQRLDLVEHQLDVAIYMGELPDSGYRAMPVGSLYECFCATPRYVQQHGSINTLADLQQQAWIAAPWQQKGTTVTDEISGISQKLALKPIAKCNTLPAAIDMALHHLGIVLMPNIAARVFIETGELVRVASHFRGPHWPIYTVHPYSQEKPVQLSRFHQLVSNRFKALA